MHPHALLARGRAPSKLARLLVCARNSGPDRGRHRSHTAGRVGVSTEHLFGRRVAPAFRIDEPFVAFRGSRHGTVDGLCQARARADGELCFGRTGRSSAGRTIRPGVTLPRSNELTIPARVTHSADSRCLLYRRHPELSLRARRLLRDGRSGHRAEARTVEFVANRACGYAGREAEMIQSLLARSRSWERGPSRSPMSCAPAGESGHARVAARARRLSCCHGGGARWA